MKRESAVRKISETGIADEVKGGPFLYYSVGNIWVAVHRIGDNFNVLTGTDQISSRYSMLSGKREMGSLFDFARSWGGYRYRYRESRPLPMGNYCAVFDGEGNILIEFDSPTASATRRMGGKPWGGMTGPKMRRLPFTSGQKKVLVIKEMIAHGAMLDTWIFPDQPCGVEGGKSLIDYGAMPVMLTPNEFRDGAIKAMN